MRPPYSSHTLAKPAKHIAEAWKVANLPNPEIVEIVEIILGVLGIQEYLGLIDFLNPSVNKIVTHILIL
jgi:hypothetical protein